MPLCVCVLISKAKMENEHECEHENGKVFRKQFKTGLNQRKEKKKI